jgi:hypothetical protein
MCYPTGEGIDQKEVAMRAGSVQNLLYDGAISKAPEVGDGATVVYWTDRVAATVVEVSKTGHRVTVREDHAIRTDTNGMSDAQSYRYEPNSNGRTYVATRRKNGSYRVTGTEMRVLFGGRTHYHDYSF